jgi:hypothetical protein
MKQDTAHPHGSILYAHGVSIYIPINQQQVVYDGGTFEDTVPESSGRDDMWEV